MDNPVVVWSLVLIAVIVFGALFYWLNDMVSKARIMRCPETGSITFVRVARVEDGARHASGLRVVQCDLWPGKKDCAQGCLTRYHEATPGLHVNLDALRPFKQQ